MRITKKRKKRISTATHNLVLDEIISERISAPMDAFGQSKEERRFIYVEIINTKPIIAYAFHAYNRVKFGRNAKEVNICIQEPEVSRIQCEIWNEGYQIFMNNLSSRTDITVKRGFNRYSVEPGEGVELSFGDVIQIGTVKFIILLIEGEDVVIDY